MFKVKTSLVYMCVHHSNKKQRKKRTKNKKRKNKEKKKREPMNFKFGKIRVLETGYNPGAWNMALDEVLLLKCISSSTANYDIPILRLYGWRPPAVSIGY